MNYKHQQQQFEIEIKFKPSKFWINKFDQPLEILYHTIDSLNNIDEEIDYIMNLEYEIPYELIKQIRIYTI